MNLLLVVSILSEAKIEYYFGTKDANLIISSFVFGCIGMIIMILLDVMSRDKKSSWSPEAFSWGYFVRDNAARFLLNFILMLVSIRFLPELIHQPITQFHALLIGIGSDQIAIIVKKKKDKFAQENIDKLVVTNTNTQSTSTEVRVDTTSPEQNG